ncbi:MAG: amino acid ABC transporter permease [Bauldia sp.]|nr:amino acid ABC transporter permease [Bauldia sp.]
MEEKHTVLPASAGRTSGEDGPDSEDLVVVPIRHYGRWIASAIVLLFLASLVHSIANNPNFLWPVFFEYLFSEVMIDGLELTVLLTVVAMIVGISGGIVLAVARLSANPVVSGLTAGYLWFFRGTPILVQLIFWYNLAALFPVISIGIPFTGPTFFEGSANDLITPFTAAVLGLGLNEAAYMAEIVRAGILSVGTGQDEAARALGMRRLLAMRRIILPQALRVIIPPTGNETIGMLKMTSLVSVIALSELLYSAQTVYSRTFETIPLLMVACFWYLVLTSGLTFAQSVIERRLGRSTAAASARPNWLPGWRRQK